MVYEVLPLVLNGIYYGGFIQVFLPLKCNLSIVWELLGRRVILIGCIAEGLVP